MSRFDVATSPTSAELMAPAVFVIGDAARREFAGIAAWVGRWASVVACPDVAAAEARLTEGLPADLVVLVESRPGEIGHREVERLRSIAPLARIVAILGSWCEGEVRVGDPWPGVVRVYWHQAEARIGRELARLAAGRCPTWGMPPTADDSERLLAEVVTNERAKHRGGPHMPFPLPFPLGEGRVEGGRKALQDHQAESRNEGHRDDDVGDTIARALSPRGLVTIASSAFAMADWLAEACRARGFSTAWQRPGQDPTTHGAVLGLWDTSVASRDELAAFRSWRRRQASAACVVLLDFPRSEDVERFLEAGAEAVLSKPVLLADLDAIIDRAVSPLLSRH